MRGFSDDWQAGLVINKGKQMKIYVASDHAGFEAKNNLIKALGDAYDIEDMGPIKFDPDDDYPVYARKVAQAVARRPNSRGILVCKSGQGMEMAANKVAGIRAALVWNEALAKETRIDNDSNVLSLPAGELSPDRMQRVTKVWLDTPFSGASRHQRRIDQITQMEQCDE